MLPVFSLKGKTVLVTGSSSGIGKAIAQQCAMAGATCIITARNEKRLQLTLESLEGDGHQMILADLSLEHNIKDLVDKLPQINGLVCCAGVVETKLLKFCEDDDMMSLFQTNAFSTIRIIRMLVQQKKLQKGSSIVLISSISGIKCGYIGGSMYGATKGALEGFSKATALELASQKIRVNTITPGMIETPILNDSEIDTDSLEKDKLKYPMKRYGMPEEVGYASVYLLSDATSWITGTSLLIDGGYTLN